MPGYVGSCKAVLRLKGITDGECLRSLLSCLRGSGLLFLFPENQYGRGMFTELWLIHFTVCASLYMNAQVPAITSQGIR